MVRISAKFGIAQWNARLPVREFRWITNVTGEDVFALMLGCMAV